MSNEPIFTTWRHAGVRFLALKKGNVVRVIDEQGHHYGSWFDVDEFRTRQRKRELINSSGIIGKAVLSIYSIGQ